MSKASRQETLWPGQRAFVYPPPAALSEAFKPSLVLAWTVNTCCIGLIFRVPLTQPLTLPNLNGGYAEGVWPGRVQVGTDPAPLEDKGEGPIY